MPVDGCGIGTPVVDVGLAAQAAERGKRVDHVVESGDRLLGRRVVLLGELLGRVVVAGHPRAPHQLLGERAVVEGGHLVAAAQRLGSAVVAAAVDRQPHVT